MDGLYSVADFPTQLRHIPLDGPSRFTNNIGMPGDGSISPSSRAANIHCTCPRTTKELVMTNLGQDADKGHVQIKDMPLEIVDLR